MHIEIKETNLPQNGITFDMLTPGLWRIVNESELVFLMTHDGALIYISGCCIEMADNEWKDSFFLPFNGQVILGVIKDER